MNIVVAATPNVAIPTIKKLKLTHEVTLVTQPDRPSGRGKQLKASDVSLAFPDVLKPENESDLQRILKEQDLLITIGYGRLLSTATLGIPKFGGINLHFSLLPKWRGAAPVQRAIEAGDKVTGVTVFQMDSGMDTGPIWRQVEYAIPPGASSSDLFDSLSLLGVDAVKASLIDIEIKSFEPGRTFTSFISDSIKLLICSENTSIWIFRFLSASTHSSKAIALEIIRGSEAPSGTFKLSIRGIGLFQCISSLIARIPRPCGPSQALESKSAVDQFFSRGVLAPLAVASTKISEFPSFNSF